MKKIAKSKGVMISSIISLLLSLAVLATVSMAWLSMNKETQSEGMKLKVEVTPNLIINVDSNALTSVDGPVLGDFSTTFVDSAASLWPATHNSSGTTMLKYVVNTNEVHPATGLAKSSATLTFSDATLEDENKYYKDFIVYIASSGKEMLTDTHQDLKVTLDPPATIDSNDPGGEDTLAAASIDFWVQTSETSMTYKGTLNVAGIPNEELVLIENYVIPYNKDGYITVLMRCYVDGALVKSSGNAYINSETVDTGDITLNVTFVAVDTSGS